MILATVGTQLPFPRLISALDGIAPSLDKKVIAQIGADPTPPTNIEWHRDFEPSEFQSLFVAADIIVSHAGIGTILAAKKHAKPIIVMARTASLGEHRNDHQLATVKQLAGRPGVYLANNESELLQLLTEASLCCAPPLASDQNSTLTIAISDFINKTDSRHF